MWCIQNTPKWIHTNMQFTHSHTYRHNLKRRRGDDDRKQMFACTLSAFHHWVSESLLVHFTVLNRPAFIIRTTNNTYLVFIPSKILTIQEFNLNFLHQCLDFFHFNYFLFFICLHIIWHFRDILLFLKYIHLLFQAKKKSLFL